MAPLNLARGSTGIDLRGVPAGSHPLVLSGESLVVDAELNRVLDAFRFTGTLEWEPLKRRIHGVLEGRFRSLCDRCLASFEKNVRLDIDVPVILETDARAPGAGATEASEEALFAAADDRMLDLSEPFRAAVLLEVPIKNLCREECRGLCPVCGVDRNRVPCTCEPDRRDARWEALRGLFPPREE